LNQEGRTTWIVDAHGYGKRFIVRGDEMLTAFLELERGIHEFCGKFDVKKLTASLEFESIVATQ
jgi:hypothetical protein